MQYERPGEIEQALALLAQGNWTVLAGGTDFFPTLKDRPPQGKILDVSALSGLRSITQQDDCWRIGALATWSDLIAADLPPAFDGLKLAAREIGSVQIQNRATLAGNICNASPAADGVPPLLTLDAEVEIISEQGTRKLPLSGFVQGNRQTDLKPEEMVSAIVIPATSAKGTSAFLKLGARKYLVISIAMVAVRLATDNNKTITDAAISIGSCSAVASRLTGLEQQLSGRKITDDLAGLVQVSHLAGLTPLNDARATATYRLEAGRELVQRAITDAAGQTQ
ncbi:MAG TPA: xanthine dehydrogenase family protein subunit M [Rhizobiales bacterium]|nr:xanthine dehydrogenase family protein subunit M [Hyphomicrobiales bacterium]